MGREFEGGKITGPCVALCKAEVRFITTALQGSLGEGAAVRRGVIRFLVVVIDASESMNQRDMRPSRIGVASQVQSACAYSLLLLCHSQACR